MTEQRRTRPASGMLPMDTAVSVERVQYRRENGKTYQIGDNKFRSSTRAGPIHYKDDYTNKDEQWKEINTSIPEAVDTMSSMPYTLQLFRDRVGYVYTSKKGGYVEIELVEIDHEPVDLKALSLRYEGDTLWYDNVARQLTLKLVVRPYRCEIFKILADETAPRHFRWRVRESTDRKLFKGTTEGTERTPGGRLEILTAITPTGISTRDEDVYFYDEEWTGRVSRAAHRSSRQREWYDDPVYPVLIDASTSEDIVANVDDGISANPGTAWFSITLPAYPSMFLGQYPGYELYQIGLRFQTLGVPKNAVINSATITLQVNTVNNGPLAIRIYGDDVDSAATFAAGGNLPRDITKTTAFASWSPTTPGTPAIPVTTIVQEIIDRAGWASGNNIRFAFTYPGAPVTVFKYILAYDYYQGNVNVAQLDVDFTVRNPRHGFVNYQVPAIF